MRVTSPGNFSVNSVKMLAQTHDVGGDREEGGKDKGKRREGEGEGRRGRTGRRGRRERAEYQSSPQKLIMMADPVPAS